MLATLGHITPDQSPGTAASTGDFGFKEPTSKDPAEKQDKVGS